jgi:hypothetical protein
MTPPTIDLTGHPVTLERPTPYLAIALVGRSDSLDAVPELAFALGAAAMRECWPEDAKWPCRSRPRRMKAGERVEEWGRTILDELISDNDWWSGPGWVKLRGALIGSYNWAISHMVSAQEVTDAVGFSEPPALGG